MRWALPGFLGALTKLLMKYIREREMYLFLFQNSKSQCQGIVILSAVLLSIPLIGLPAEVLQRSGVASFAEARWWAVGAAKLAGEDLNYLGVAGLRIAGGQGILIIAVCQVRGIIMGGQSAGFFRCRVLTMLSPRRAHMMGGDKAQGCEDPRVQGSSSSAARAPSSLPTGKCAILRQSRKRHRNPGHRCPYPHSLPGAHLDGPGARRAGLAGVRL